MTNDNDNDNDNMEERYELTDLGDLAIPHVNQDEIFENLERFRLGESTEEDEEELVYYVIREFQGQGKSWTTEDLIYRTGEIRTGHILRHLEKEGLVDSLVDENGEFLFQLTPEGRQVAKELLQ